MSIFRAPLAASFFFKNVLSKNICTLRFRSFSLFQNKPRWTRPKIYALLGASIGILSLPIGYHFLAETKEKGIKPPKPVGYPSIGGDFNLIDHNGHRRTRADFKGKWTLIYFGFCHCPDICPEQLEKIAEIYNRVAYYGKGDELVPIFITIDPERDTPEMIRDYVKEFSPHMIGLTGGLEEIKDVAKRYRIYFSAGEKDVTGDYIVDHSIIFYLFDPSGLCLDLFGPNKSVQDSVKLILERMKLYQSS